VLPSLKEHRPQNDSNHITNSTSFISQAAAQSKDTETRWQKYIHELFASFYGTHGCENKKNDNQSI